MRQRTRCAFGAPPGARCGECGATEEQGAVLIPQKASRGPRYLCHTHHNANRPRPARFAIPATDNAEEPETTEAPEEPEEQEEGHLEYIETGKWKASAAKLEATLEATRRLQKRAALRASSQKGSNATR